MTPTHDIILDSHELLRRYLVTYYLAAASQQYFRIGLMNPPVT